MTLSRETYLEWKNRHIRSEKLKPKERAHEKVKSDRDPTELKSVMASLMSEYGWDKEMQTSAVLEQWPEIVGEEIAGRTRIVAVREGVLHVECQSTPWSVQLRRMKLDILDKIKASYPKSQIEDLRFTVPGIPTWKYGNRSIPGRGPRDTYK